jgi:hypothetical protein
MKKRFSPRGLKVAKKLDTDVINNAFMACQDSKERGTDKCRMLEEASIKKACKLTHACEFEIRRHGATLAFRFVSADGKLVNEELK